MFVVVIGLLIVSAPASFGFSIIFIQFLSRPWNEFISRFVDLQYADGATLAVLPGLLINASILYLSGYAVDRLLRRQKALD